VSTRWDAARARRRGANLAPAKPLPETTLVRCPECGASANVPVVDAGNVWLDAHTARHHSQESLF